MIGERRNGGAKTTIRLWSSTASPPRNLLQRSLHPTMKCARFIIIIVFDILLTKV